MSSQSSPNYTQMTFGQITRKLVNGGTPPTEIAQFWNGKIPWITGADFTSNGIGEFRRFVSEMAITQTATNLIDQGQLLLVTRTGVGKLAVAPCDIAISQDITGVYPDTEKVDINFLYHRMRLGVEDLKKLNQGTSINGIIRKDLLAYPIELPELPQQRRIAEILSTLDEAIEQTEALIAKHQQIKAGLMHDLFTRGVTPDGHLRPTRDQAPDLYKDSPLGWIPKEWDLKSISTIADSLVDGPFGSNLKSEHYVVEPGVRVVRLQNIQEGYYNDRDPAFISQRHADYLMRNAVNPGDVLIAALGDESYPVGRTCCYPTDLPPAINKADCFRLRCHPEVGINTYVMHFLNTAAARNQVKRFEQGVTRRRMNLGNLRRVIVALPSLDEQKCIIQRLAVFGEQIKVAELQAEKLRQQKQGLMHDLLTGRVVCRWQRPNSLN